MYGCAAMVHRRNETSEEKTRWVSSQVVGESTAQTVTIKSIGVMRDIPELRPTMITQKATVTNAAKFHYPVKKPKLRRAPALKINAKNKPCLMAFEIDEIKAGS